MYQTELSYGREEPLPEYFWIIREARYWGVSPMEIREWPMEWIWRSRLVQEAEAEARRQQQGGQR